MNTNKCFFTGHRRLPSDRIKEIVTTLDREIDNLISEGVTDFISGGALGFDQIAASLIIAKKKMEKNIRLIFALPCKNQDKLWTEKQKTLYKDLLGEADQVIYVSKAYSNSCMCKRNRYMVQNLDYCICALLHGVSGTGQTVRLARKSGLRVINVAEK